jgi:hypothetical protein
MSLYQLVKITSSRIKIRLTTCKSVFATIDYQGK